MDAEGQGCFKVRNSICFPLVCLIGWVVGVRTYACTRFRLFVNLLPPFLACMYILYVVQQDMNCAFLSVDGWSGWSVFNEPKPRISKTAITLIGFPGELLLRMLKMLVRWSIFARRCDLPIVPTAVCVCGVSAN